MKNKTFWLEGVLVAVLVIGATLAWFLFRPGPEGEAVTALVTIDGSEVMRVDLSEEREAYIIDLSGYTVPAKLEVKGHQIRFIEVDCPDHICEKTGFISRESQSAVCMPNKTAVVIYATEEMR